VTATAAASAHAIWARGFGVTLVRGADASAPAIAAALADGIERGFAGALPPPPAGLECYGVLAGRRPVGVLACAREQAGARVVLHALAIAASDRGHAYGARALRCAERQLEPEGVREFYARVPRTNGHGLYFMLRCGYAPLLQSPHADGATWFRRARVARAPGRGALASAAR